MGKMLPYGHKQLHIEAEKKQANHIRRGKRSGRAKGVKARRDELESGKRHLEKAKSYNWKLGKSYFEQLRLKQIFLINKAIKDNIMSISEALGYIVNKDHHGKKSIK